MSDTQDITSEEGGRIPLTQTDRLHNPTGGDVEYDDSYTGTGYENSARDIERILDGMAEKAAHSELETRRAAELNELAGAISYGDIHKGVNFKVHRMTDVPEDLIEA